MLRTESVVEERTPPSPEVLAKPVRRRFTMEYKARILAEADACTEPGRLGELLRREGLYSSHLTTWRRQRENQRLKEQLRQAELIIDVQKKVAPRKAWEEGILSFGADGVRNGDAASFCSSSCHEPTLAETSQPVDN